MHPHENRGIERRFVLSIAITALIFFAELIGGLWTGSLALVSDSAHMFMDIFALALSFAALRLSALPPDSQHTYGYHRLEVLAALANGLSLAAISLGIWWEAVQRFQQPQDIHSFEMLVIAVIGLASNLAVAFILGGHTHEEGHHDHSAEDLNVHSAFLHVLGDAVSSVGVIAAAGLIAATGWQWIDPLMSILIGCLIAWSSYRITRQALHILIEGTPEGIKLDAVRQTLLEVEGVSGVHELHIWNICSGHVALSAHILLSDFQTDHALLRGRIRAALLNRHGIEHTTLQFEAEPCEDQACGCDAPAAAHPAN